MSTSASSIPALISAFTFGIVVSAALASFVLHLTSHGATVFRDGPRLVLAIFLLSAALWAQIDFISIAIDTTATTACQVGVVLHTLFDQFARFAMEQFLLWAIHNGTKSGVWQLVPQILVSVRFILGVVFVGLTRPQFDPVCVPASSVLAIALVVLILDAVILLLLVVRVFASGLVADIRAGKPSAGRGKAILLVIVMLAAWTAMSILLVLGLQTTTLLLRTLLPSIGLLALIFVVTVSNPQLTEGKSRLPRAPESPAMRDANASRSISTGGSSVDPPRRFEDYKRDEIAAFERSHGTAGLFVQAAASASEISPVPVPIPGQLFPPMRADTAPAALQRRMGPGGLAAGKLVISNPILQTNGDQNPLNKIATISLADAVRNERERRGDDLHRDSALIAKRPAPKPPGTPAVKRKTVGSMSSQQIFQQAAEASLMPTATTSSAQLSPGVEEIRRRSPRQAPAVERTIRPSRQFPEPEPTKTPKTPVQRRPTTGLPNNPRAIAMKAMVDEADSQRQQTVLFVNRIEYDNPDAVESILQGGNPKMANALPDFHFRPDMESDVRASVSSMVSMVHRPRPIPRKLEEDRNIFPAEASPMLAGHRRSKSAGSIGLRKSALRYASGSPPQLPPLPPLPTNFATYMGGLPDTNRPLPNNTKSMTFDEKMALLFPPAPSASADGSLRRRSSVPEIPSIPFDFMLPPLSPRDAPSSVSRSTSQTGKTSVQTENLLEVVELPRIDEPLPEPLHLSDEAGDAWAPGMDTGDLMLAMQRALERNSSVSRRTNDKRASSPVLPPMRDSVVTMSSDTQSHDAYTHWGSVHSSVVAMPLQNRVARSMYLHGDQREAARAAPPPRPTPRVDSPPLTDEEDETDAPLQVQASWHHRVGDNCPTFTGRDKAWSRKMAPPTPLQLGPPSTRRPVLAKAAEPSPLESPEHALAMIQAQLRKFEEAALTNESASQQFHLLDDLEREMDAHTTNWQTMQRDLGRSSMSTLRTPSVPGESRRQSTVSIEIEAGNGVGDKVNYETMTGGRGIGADRRASRRQRLQSGLLGVPGNGWQRTLAEMQTGLRSSNDRNMSDLGSPTPPDSEDEMYLDETVETVQVAEAVKIAAAPPAQLLWTPRSGERAAPRTATLWRPASPMDVPMARVDPIDSVVEQAPAQATGRRLAMGEFEEALPIEKTGLWTDRHATAVTQPASASLWVGSVAPVAPASPVSPVSPSPAPEESSALFAEAPTDEAVKATAKTTVEDGPSQQKPARPLTQRPPRRSRRMTVLPDILENPEPLPDKRGTLGIFQFPWGERSDTATVAVRVGTLMAMPGTMSSGGGPSRSVAQAYRVPQPEEDDYGSSFFDAYDEEDELDKEVQGSDDDEPYSDSDDGFDENTLWEIASLLQSQDVPSTYSLLPPPLEEDAVVDDYLTELPSDEEDELAEGGGEATDALSDYGETEIFVGMDVADMQRGLPGMTATSLLWTSGEAAAKEPVSMAQPDEATWKQYDSVSAAATARAKPRVLAAAPIASSQLWAAEDDDDALPPMPALLWSPVVVAAVQTEKLWAPRSIPQALPTDNKHLFDLAVATAERRAVAVRTTEQAPASIDMPRRARKAVAMTEALPTLASTQLWTAAVAVRAGPRLWAPRPVPSIPAAQARTMMLFDLATAVAARMAAAVVRTSAEEPAALHMPRKARKPSHAALPVLASARLWQSAQTMRVHKALWAPQVHAAVPAKGFLFDPAVAMAEKRRAHTRTSDQEPAALHMRRQARKASHAPLARLASTRLWQMRAQQALWAPKTVTAAAAAVTAKGLLFDPAVAAAEKRGAPTRTSEQEPAALCMPRKPRQTSHAPLARLTSTRLWQVRAPKALWMPKAEPPAAVAASGLLFDLAAARAEKTRALTRSTDKEPAAVQMPRRARPPHQALLEKLLSSGLWQTRSSAAAADKTLWAPKAAVVAVAATTTLLFDHAAARAALRNRPTRSSEQEPAALHMPRRVRKAHAAPLSTLVSQNLWRSAQASRVSKRTLWVPRRVVRTVRGDSSSSSSSSPSLFTLEAAQAEKQAQVVRTTDAEPVAAQGARVPRAMTALPALPLTSTRLWSDTNVVVSQAPVDWIAAGTAAPVWWEAVGATTVTRAAAATTTTTTAVVDADALVEAARAQIAEPEPTTRGHRAVALSGWDVALHEAMAASYPRQQRTATAADWQRALATAVAASYPFDAARRHPATAGDAVYGALAHDVHKGHPVFFGEAPVKIVVEAADLVEAEAEKTTETVQQTNPRWSADPRVILAQVAALEEERAFAAATASSQMAPSPGLMPSVVSPSWASPLPSPGLAVPAAADDAQYDAYIQALENDAKLRLQAFEGLL